jgi:regulator of protease activity HflC (stomatin/prohibitin superfamily)
MPFDLSIPQILQLAGGIILVWLIISSLKVIKEYQRAVIFTFGRFTRIGGPGIYFIIPIIENQNVLDIRTVTMAIDPQETITRDSVTVKINAVVWYKVVDSRKAVISVADYRHAVTQAAMTSLRNIIGQNTLDDILRERQRINDSLEKIVDETTEPWGVRIEAIEMKDVEIPLSMQRAMAQEAEATREQRARLIKAQAELEASEKLGQAARLILDNPVALELRRMQMIQEVGAEHNSTTIIFIPSDFVNMAKSFSEQVTKAMDRQNINH